MASSNGGEKLDTINKARLRTHFIDIKQYLDESSEQEMSRIVLWKQLSDAISSTGSLKLEDVKPSLLLDNLEYQDRSVVGFYSCNKAVGGVIRVQILFMQQSLDIYKMVVKSA